MTLGRLVLAAVALSTPPAAQDLRLSWSMRAPLVYLSAEPGLAKASVRVEDLLSDPALSVWLGLPQSTAPATARGGASAAGGASASHALAALQRVLAAGAEARAARTIELALTGVVPRRGGRDLPLLIFRAELTDDAAARLRLLLEQPALARPHRELSGHTVFVLGGVSRDRRASPVEVALVGNDLVASNHAEAMDEVLGADGGEDASRALAAQPAFRSLREQVTLSPGSILLYADVSRVRHWLSTSRSVGTRWLAVLPSVKRMQRMLCVIRPGSQGIRTSLLVQHDGLGEQWLSETDPRRAQDLAALVPGAGIGGVAFAANPVKLLMPEPRRRPRSSELFAMHGSLGRVSRLFDPGGVGRGLEPTFSVGLVAVESPAPKSGAPESGAPESGAPGSGASASVPVFTLHARSAAAARKLLADCKKTMAQTNAVSVRRGPRGVEQLELRAGADRPLFLGVVRDTLVVARDGRALDSATAAADRRSAEHIRATMAGLQRLGALREAVNGVFCVDPSAAVLGLEPLSRPSYLLRRHTGYLQAHPRLIQVEVLTEI